MPPRIKSIAHRHLKQAVEITIAKEPVKAGAAPRVQQTAYVVTRQHRGPALVRILDMAGPKSALVFCRTRVEVDDVTAMLDQTLWRLEDMTSFAKYLGGCAANIASQHAFGAVAFWLLDASVGFRLPQRYGILSFSVRNLLDQRFDYLDVDSVRGDLPRTPRYVPDRTFFGQVTLSF